MATPKELRTIAQGCDSQRATLGCMTQLFQSVATSSAASALETG